MNALQLVKHHGFGNDFLIAFDVGLQEAELATLARAVCRRRRGIGADGLLIGDERFAGERPDGPVQRRWQPS